MFYIKLKDLSLISKFPFILFLNEKIRKNFYFFLYGFSSIFIQTYLLRETNLISGGNELSFGFFFFFWFSGIFFGAILGKRYKGRDDSFIFFLSLFPFLVFIEYIFSFYLNSLNPIPLGSEPTLIRGIIFSFPLAFISGFFVGFLFPLSLIYFKNLTSIFFFESLGSFFSGLALTYFLLSTFSPYKALCLLSIIFLLFTFKYFKIILIIPIIFLLSEEKFNEMRYKTIGLLGEVEKEIQTPYQNIIITSLQETKAVYLNGRFSTQYPGGEALNLRYLSFFPFPEECKDVLIYGFPLGNEEIAKKIVIKSLTLIEPDPFLLKQFFKSDLKNLFYVKEDFRFFLKRQKNIFDLIILDISPPSSLLSSRNLTFESFSLIKKSLKKGGYFILYLPFSENFWGKELENYTSTIYNTLKKVFNEVQIGFNISPFFICGFEKIDIEEILKRGEEIFKEREIFSPSIIPYFFSKERIDFFKEKLERGEKEIAKDQKPFFFLEVLKFKSKMEKDKIFYMVLSLSKYYLLFLLILPLFFLKKKNREYFSVFSNGFIGIGLYLILSYLFQVKNGIFYSKVGFLTSLFMLGLSLSSPFAKFLRNKNFKTSSIDLIFILYLTLIPLSFSLSSLFFYLFFLLAGFFSGLPFTFVGLLKGGDQRAGANVEAMDHIGASLGSIITGAFFVPFFGIHLTILSFLIIKIISFLLNLSGK